MLISSNINGTILLLLDYKHFKQWFHLIIILLSAHNINAFVLTLGDYFAALDQGLLVVGYINTLGWLRGLVLPEAFSTAALIRMGLRRKVRVRPVIIDNGPNASLMCLLTATFFFCHHRTYQAI